jgi:hypothetical protein
MRGAAQGLVSRGVVRHRGTRLACPVIMVICDNESIHHANAVTTYLREHPRLDLLYGAR